MTNVNIKKNGVIISSSFAEITNIKEEENNNINFENVEKVKIYKKDSYIEGSSFYEL